MICSSLYTSMFSINLQVQNLLIKCWWNWSQVSFPCPKYWTDTLELEVWFPLDTRTFNFVLRTTLTWSWNVFFPFHLSNRWREQGIAVHSHSFLPSLSLSIVFPSISYLSNAYFRWKREKNDFDQKLILPNFILCISSFLLLSLAIAY